MKTQLVAEQTAQRAVYEDQMVDCNDETALRTGEMDEASSAELAAQTNLDACTESQGIYTEGEVQLSGALASKRTQL